MFLCIQNPGVAPVEGFTLLGVSTTRDCGVAGTIGQFGSGAKHAINTLLRAGLKLLIYCGKTRLEFATRDETIRDGLVTKNIKRVVCKLGGPAARRWTWAGAWTSARSTGPICRWPCGSSWPMPSIAPCGKRPTFSGPAQRRLAGCHR